MGTSKDILLDQIYELEEKLRKKTIAKDMENELYSFIVDSNLEGSLIDQLNNPKLKKRFEKWLQVD